MYIKYLHPIRIAPKVLCGLFENCKVEGGRGSLDPVYNILSMKNVLQNIVLSCYYNSVAL